MWYERLSKITTVLFSQKSSEHKSARGEIVHEVLSCFRHPSQPRSQVTQATACSLNAQICSLLSKRPECKHDFLLGLGESERREGTLTARLMCYASESAAIISSGDDMSCLPTPLWSHKGFRLQCHSTHQRPHNPTIPQWWGYYRSARKRTQWARARERKWLMVCKCYKARITNTPLHVIRTYRLSVFVWSCKLVTDTSYYFEEAHEEEDCQLFAT